MQYLVSVIFDKDGLATPDEDAAIDVFNDRLVAEGHWVFAGGLASPSSATVIDNRGEEAMVTDGPFLESKEHIAGFWIIEAADLDVALRLAAEGSKGLQPEGRGAAVPVSAADVMEAVTRAHHEEWARVVASLTRRFGDLDIAEEATAEAFATAVERWPADGAPQSRRLADHHRQPQGHRPDPAREQARRQAEGGSAAVTTTTRPSLPAPSTTSGSG